jgi:hypothetical protein
MYILKDIRTMEKNTQEKLTVQDLAMFIGCEVIKTNDSNYGKIKSVHGGNVPYIEIEYNSCILPVPIEDVKLILRSIDSMTDDEAYEVGELTDFWNPGVAEDYKRRKIWLIKQQAHQVRFKAHALKFLISKNFDVFGWIEKGLAIKK